MTAIPPTTVHRDRVGTSAARRETARRRPRGRDRQQADLTSQRALDLPDDVAGLFLHHVSVVVALGRGDFAYAYREVKAAVEPGAAPSSAPEVLWFLLDFTEAAERSGHHEEATAHKAAIDEAADLVADSPRLSLHAQATAALLASGSVAEEIFEEALRTPGAEAYPFDLARVHLLYGEHLRRTFAPTRAREHLEVARSTFCELGASLWLERADAELRTVTPERGRARVAELTPQELEIARLAASGLSNKEIAQQRYLSPRTVSAHLYRVFPKLGITSRAALRDALSSLEAGTAR